VAAVPEKTKVFLEKGSVSDGGYTDCVSLPQKGMDPPIILSIHRCDLLLEDLHLVPGLLQDGPQEEVA
jgi:hypothetical protein